MDIDQIRRENLKRIDAELGGPAEAARACGMAPAQFINLRDGAKDSKTGKPRGMRKETARRIERATGKPPGWLDVDHGDAGTTVDNTPASPPDVTELLAKVLANVPDSLRPAAGKLLESLAASPDDEAIQRSLALIFTGSSSTSRHRGT